jgi:hypothetical protein
MKSQSGLDWVLAIDMTLRRDQKPALHPLWRKVRGERRTR